jgi:hypothetical protein
MQLVAIITQLYVAPHTAQIHTLIKRGISIRIEPLVLKARKRRSAWVRFPSPAPWFCATPANAGHRQGIIEDAVREFR